MADYPQVIQPGQDPASKIAAATSGLIGGLNDYSRYQTEKQLATQKMEAALSSQNLEVGPDDHVRRNPIAEAQYQEDLANRDAGSAVSKRKVAYGTGLLKQAGISNPEAYIQEPKLNPITGKYEGGTSGYEV